MLKAYQNAAQIYCANQEKHVLNETIAEKWIEGSDDFWFEFDVKDPEGKVKPEYRRFIAAKGITAPLFDYDAFIQAIKPWKEDAGKWDLGIALLDVNDHTRLIYFTIKDTVGEFAYHMDNKTIEQLRYELHAKTEVTSPDLMYSAFVKEYDVYVRNNQTGKESRLTFDGSEQRPYANHFTMVSEKLIKKTPKQFSPAISWSPDSKRLLTYRKDMRKMDHLHLVQSVPLDGSARPIGVHYAYSLPADEDILTAQVYVADMDEMKASRVHENDGKALELLLLSMFDSSSDEVKWTKDGKTAYLVLYDRYFHEAKAVLIDTAAATARVAATQQYETFGFTEYFGNAAQESFQDSGLFYIPEDEKLIWLLERENWASLYLIDAKTGTFEKDLTPGEYTARRIRHYDTATKTLYFSASGKETDVDPYIQFLYKLDLGSGEIVRITEESAEHHTRFSKSGSYFIDTYSTIQTVPRTTVCDPNGQCLADIATADIQSILDKGYIVPEPFEALARDGKTKIYGILIKPRDFDPGKKYPVVDYIYGGCQRINTPKAFEFHSFLESDPQGGLQSLAQLGFVGVIVDGLATPLRSKAIHDVAYTKAEECCGIEDHVCAIKELAKRYAWIDADRVGIWGASGGGYATVRAMLQFPAFFKVGVSLCGNHDQAKYHAHWGDRWIGPYSEERYHDQANRNFAQNLEGELLLVHGDMDDNVHPSATIALAGALIEANKDFDLLIYPNSAHGVGQFPYVVRRRWDFFVTHLMGKTPPKNFRIPKKEEK